MKNRNRKGNKAFWIIAFWNPFLTLYSTKNIIFRHFPLSINMHLYSSYVHIYMSDCICLYDYTGIFRFVICAPYALNKNRYTLHKYGCVRIWRAVYSQKLLEYTNVPLIIKSFRTSNFGITLSEIKKNITEILNIIKEKHAFFCNFWI